MADTLKGVEVAVLDSLTTVLTCVTSGTTVVQSLMIGNVDGVADVTVDLYINRNGAGDTKIVDSLNVEAGKMVAVFGGGITGRCFLVDDGTPDVIKAQASVTGDAVITVSYIERV